MKSERLRLPALVSSVPLSLTKAATWLVAVWVCLAAVNAQQPAAPKIDGVAGPTEYGVRREGENAKVSGGAP